MRLLTVSFCHVQPICLNSILPASVLITFYSSFVSSANWVMCEVIKQYYPQRLPLRSPISYQLQVRLLPDDHDTLSPVFSQCSTQLTGYLSRPTFFSLCTRTLVKSMLIDAVTVSKALLQSKLKMKAEFCFAPCVVCLDA